MSINTLSAPTPAAQPLDARRRRALAVLAGAQFLAVMDAASINVALPSISRDLHVPVGDLAWIVNAYFLTFGGFLLLGGRLADLYGRRRVFVVGLLVFAGASLAGGLAGSQGALIIARAVQGAGAALLIPAALSLVVALFAPGGQRNVALGAWGAAASAGGAAGGVLGGLITDVLGWEWSRLFNALVATIFALLALRLIAESRSRTAGRGFDLAGAITATAGLSVLVYAIVEAGSAGWGSWRTSAWLALAAVLLATFVVIERRTVAPLVPFDVFRLRTVVGANAAMLCAVGAVFGLSFVLAIYTQVVLGYSALESGLAKLPLAATLAIAKVAVSPIVTRLGSKPVLLAGLTLFAGGLAWFARIPENGSFVADLLGPSLLVGLGIAATLTPLSIAAVEGVTAKQYGLAAGLISTTYQIGGALGLAILASVAASRTARLIEGGSDPTAALTEGFQLGLIVAAGFVVATILVVIVVGGGTRPHATRRGGARRGRTTAISE